MLITLFILLLIIIILLVIIILKMRLYYKNITYNLTTLKQNITYTNTKVQDINAKLNTSIDVLNKDYQRDKVLFAKIAKISSTIHFLTNMKTSSSSNRKRNTEPKIAQIKDNSVNNNAKPHN